MEWLGHRDTEMVRHYYHLHDKEARRQMNRLDPLGNAGKQLPDNDNGAANNNQGAPPNPERTGENSLVTALIATVIDTVHCVNQMAGRK